MVEHELEHMQQDEDEERTRTVRRRRVPLGNVKKKMMMVM